VRSPRPRWRTRSTDYYVEALQAEEVDPVAQPELDVEHFDEHEGCAFTATVEVRPTFEPPDHTGITSPSRTGRSSDDEVDEQLEQLRERFAEVDEVDRAAAHGDLVTIDLDVEVDGEELEDAHVSDALYEVGSRRGDPEARRGARRQAAGDEFSYDDTLPDGYPEHGGKQATFTCHVTDVRAKTLPELDDDFARPPRVRHARRAACRRARLAAASRIQQAQHELRGRCSRPISRASTSRCRRR
jgi:trigger factor